MARRFNAEAEDHYRYLWSQLDGDEQQALLSPNEVSDAARKVLLAKALIRSEQDPSPDGPRSRWLQKPVTAPLCAFQPCLCHLLGGQAARREADAHGNYRDRSCR